MDREELFAVAALGAIIVVTFGWWMLALWPVPAEGADWLLRTRVICFGATASGLPAAEGWALLIGQPLTMTAVLLVGWGGPTRSALHRIAGSLGGRVAVASIAALLALGAGAATVRVAEASAAARGDLLVTPGTPAADVPRIDRAAPSPLALIDQRGDTFDLADYRGRPVLVTFAFAHCETVCPVLVRDVLDAQRTADGQAADRPAVVVVTVDPWRDTPARLPHVAHQWGLDPDAHVLSGAVDAVLAELEAWEVFIDRDLRTGDIIHPALVYVIDTDGRLAFATNGGGDHAVDLLTRLEDDR